MKLKYPAEAFALGMILFSAGMKEAFAAGILVILAVVFAEFLKNLLEPLVPDWSLKACVLIGTAAVTASAFLWGFTTLGIAVDTALWLMTVIIGLFAAVPVLTVDLEADYGGILWESAIVWASWIVFAMVRELACTGSIFGNVLVKTAFQSKFFGQPTFGFIVAGMVLAFANYVLRKGKRPKMCTYGLLLSIPVIVYVRPFAVDFISGIPAHIWTILVPIALFWSVKKVIRFSKTGVNMRGLPVEMMSMGFIYMILSIY